MLPVLGAKYYSVADAPSRWYLAFSPEAEPAAILSSALAFIFPALSSLRCQACSEDTR